jgi:hypothetical protein
VIDAADVIDVVDVIDAVDVIDRHSRRGGDVLWASENSEFAK